MRVIELFKSIQSEGLAVISILGESGDSGFCLKVVYSNSDLLPSLPT